MDRSRRAAPRRPLTRIANLLLGAHVAFELGAGVGLPLASVAGPVPAGAALVGGTAVVQRLAGRPGPSALRAFATGLGVAATVAHLLAWPRRRTRLGLPWLTDCEGLGPGLMRWYNPILYAGGAASVAALAVEERSRGGAAAVGALALVPALVAVQRAEHQRLRAIARRRPSWWNRRLR